MLQKLVDADPAVASAAAEFARSLLGEVSCDQIALEVREAVASLGLDNLDAGPTPWGYTEPVEVAWDVLDATLKPFLEDLARRIELDHEGEALEVCTGILLGLYGLREETQHDVLMHASDFPAEAAAEAVALWRRTRRSDGRKSRRRRPGFPLAFVEERLPEWSGFLDRMLRRRSTTLPI